MVDGFVSDRNVKISVLIRELGEIDFTPTLGGWDLTMTLEPPERANKMLTKSDSGN